MSNLWICWNSPNAKGVPGLPFEADAPVCPECGADGRLPEYARAVGRRERVHFDPPHKVLRGKGTNRRACDGRPVAAGGGRATGHPAAVTCPDCRATDAHRAAAEAHAADVVPEGHDFAIQG